MLATSAAVILALVLGIWAAYHAARALTTGIARASHGAHYDRAGQPGWFWFTVMGQIAIVLGCAYLIVHLLGGGIRGGA